MNKRFIGGLAAVAVAFSGAGALPVGTFEGFSLTASAADIVSSGVCGRVDENEGKNVIWTLDSNGTLTISGTGNMTDYSYDSNKAPWYDDRIVIGYVKEIIKVYKIIYGMPIRTEDGRGWIVEDEEITFDGVSYYWPVNEENVPKKVITEKKELKGKANISEVIIGDGVTRIGNYAFVGYTSLVSITIPDSVTSIGGCAFGYNDGNGNKIEDFTITGYDGTAAEKYAAENGFKFVSLGEAPVKKGDLDGIDGVNVDDLVLMQKAVAGWRVDYNDKAADLDGDNDVDVDDLVLMQKKVAGWAV